MMRLLGHKTRVMTYMMGNNVVVETMYRHDPAVMLYAPLRKFVFPTRRRIYRARRPWYRRPTPSDHHRGCFLGPRPILA
ncbi:hypothetical protein [uncultured Mycobacterium sp.]|uniref:hypothetical protein n=1 Tax=uncultured Mycobacterium sp. TaxID=171292 RepID=UPI0035CB4F07